MAPSSPPAAAAAGAVTEGGKVGGSDDEVAAAVKVLSSVKAFGGTLFRCSHRSAALGGLTATFSAFLPFFKSPEGEGIAETSLGSGSQIPFVVWLSGLTCTDETFPIKAGPAAFEALVSKQIGMVFPDTSPRGANVEGEDDDWTLGTGASFYVDATQGKWKTNYRMFSYITDEFLRVVESTFPAFSNGKKAISGHSMGGHGALVIALKNPQLFNSVSVFAPVCNPINCEWGKAAFRAYLGEDEEAWKLYDATELIKAGSAGPQGGGTGDTTMLSISVPHILIDQGDNDAFLKEQLKPSNLQTAMAAKKVPLDYRQRSGYNHSYFYISSFIREHIEFHEQFIAVK